MRETWVRSLGWEDPLEKGKAIHSSILAWRIPWTIQSTGSQRVGHDWVTFTFTGIFSPNHLTHTAFHKHCWNSGVYGTCGQIRSTDFRGWAHRGLWEAMLCTGKARRPRMECWGAGREGWSESHFRGRVLAVRGERDDVRVISGVGQTGFSAE